MDALRLIWVTANHKPRVQLPPRCHKISRPRHPRWRRKRRPPPPSLPPGHKAAEPIAPQCCAPPRPPTPRTARARSLLPRHQPGGHQVEPPCSAPRLPERALRQHMTQRAVHRGPQIPTPAPHGCEARLPGPQTSIRRPSQHVIPASSTLPQPPAPLSTSSVCHPQPLPMMSSVLWKMLLAPSLAFSGTSTLALASPQAAVERRCRGLALSPLTSGGSRQAASYLSHQARRRGVPLAPRAMTIPAPGARPHRRRQPAVDAHALPRLGRRGMAATLVGHPPALLPTPRRQRRPESASADRVIPYVPVCRYAAHFGRVGWPSTYTTRRLHVHVHVCTHVPVRYPSMGVSVGQGHRGIA